MFQIFITTKCLKIKNLKAQLRLPGHEVEKYNSFWQIEVNNLAMSVQVSTSQLNMTDKSHKLYTKSTHNNHATWNCHLHETHKMLS